LADAGSTTSYKVSGVAIDNSNVATQRKQYFGYGPVAGGIPTPTTPVTPANLSVATGVSFNKARTADLSSPFGDGKFFWVAEDTLDKNPAPDAPPDTTSAAACNTVDDNSSERNWWFADLRSETNSDHPGSGHEDFLAHAVRRFGGRPG